MKLFGYLLVGIFAQEFCINDADCKNMMQDCRTSECFCDEGTKNFKKNRVFVI